MNQTAAYAVMTPMKQCLCAGLTKEQQWQSLAAANPLATC